MMSLHTHPWQRYGSNTQRRVREFEKRLHQKAKCSNSHIFNMRCCDEVKIGEGYSIAKHASKAFLRARVHQTVRRKQSLLKQIAKLEASLEKDLPTKDYSKVTKLSHNSAEKIFVKSKQNHQSKLKALLKHKQKHPELRLEGRDRWVVNLTESSLTQPARSFEYGS